MRIVSRAELELRALKDGESGRVALGSVCDGAAVDGARALAERILLNSPVSLRESMLTARQLAGWNAARQLGSHRTGDHHDPVVGAVRSSG
jgi:hypothetical protein